MNYILRLTKLFALLLCGHVALLAQNGPRTIVTTDGEIDDVDSFIRMLLYSNEFRLEGLVYSSSQWHYKGDGKGTKFTSELEMTRNMYGERTELRWPGVTWMTDLIAAYEKVYPVLSTHAKGYPTAAYLRSIISVGNIDFEGEMEKVTPGSEFIREKLLDDNTEPIYLQVWGGTNTIARALKSIEETYKNTPQWEAIYQKVGQKAIIYAILDQDATYRKYIAQVWPNIRVLYNSKQFWCLAYFWKKAVQPAQHQWFEGKFMGDEIITNHGPLTQMYYSYGDGQKQEGDPEHIHGDPAKLKNGQWGSFEKFDFISEGDSPSFLHLIDVGLDNLDHPEYGGWGGRLTPSKTAPNRWEDGDELAELNPYSGQPDAAYPQTRWLEAIQLDFAARADWCVKTRAQANHPPVVQLKSKKQIAATPGATIRLKSKCTDPDGNTLTYQWWQYAEAGTFRSKVEIQSVNQANTAVKIPGDLKKGETIHLILQVTDDGLPRLTRYQRVVITGR